MSLDSRSKYQMLNVENLEEPEKLELHNLILSNDIEFQDNGEEFEAIIRVKHFPGKPNQINQRNEMRQTFTDKLMINKVFNLIVKEKDLLKEIRERRLSDLNKMKRRGNDSSSGGKRMRQSVVMKKSLTIEEKDVEMNENDTRRDSKGNKEKKMRYSIVKSQELEELFKTKKVAEETEKLIQKEKVKEKERINGFTEWVTRKRAISEKQRSVKESYFNFGKNRDSVSNERKAVVSFVDQQQIKMNPLDELEEVVQVLAVNNTSPKSKEPVKEEHNKRGSENSTKIETAPRSSLQDIQEFQKLLNRIVEGDLNEEEENQAEGNSRSDKINQELRNLEVIQSEIKGATYDLEKLNKIFELPRLYKDEEENGEKRQSEAKSCLKKYKAFSPSDEKSDALDERKLENVFRRSFLNQVKHWGAINFKDQNIIQQHYKRTLKEMQNNLKILNSSELVSYYKFLVNKARSLFTKYMREHALANQI